MCSATFNVTMTWRHHGVERSLSAKSSISARPACSACEPVLVAEWLGTVALIGFDGEHASVGFSQQSEHGSVRQAEHRHLALRPLHELKLEAAIGAHEERRQPLLEPVADDRSV